MNLVTGLKEARLNVPEGDGGSPADIVVIDNLPVRREEDEIVGANEENEGLLVQDQAAPHNPFVGDHDIRPPPRMPRLDPDELSTLELAAKILTSSPSTNPREYLADLTALTDLAHDLEWGTRLMQEEAFSKRIIQLISPNSYHANTEIRSAAALLLGTALQNNQAALKQLLKHSSGRNDVDPITAVTSGLEQLAELRDIDHEDMIYAKRLVFLLSQLCHDEEYMRRFMGQSGLQFLLKIYKDERLTGVEGGAMLNVKIKNFVDDYRDAMLTFDELHLLRKF